MENRKDKARRGAANSVGSSWLILLSETGLRALQHSNFLLPAFLEQVKFLQKGKWNQSKSALLNCPGSSIEIYLCPITHYFYLVWQVDVVYLHPLRSYSQIVKVWDVTDSAGVTDNLNNITVVHKTYQHDHTEACQLRHAESCGRVLPIIFPNSTMVLLGPKLRSQTDFDVVNRENIVTTLKFVPLSTTLVRCIQFGVRGEIPFLLSKEEYEVIEQEGSVLLLGRSGTGKTTCLVFRLHNAYKGLFSTAIPSLNHWEPYFSDIQQGLSSINQVFVTVSPILCERIRRYFLKLKVAMEASLSDEDSIKAAINHAQVIQEMKDSMLEEEDEDIMFSSIPDDFGLLSNNHFPLFITYGKLLRMLKGTVIASINAQQEHRPPRRCMEEPGRGGSKLEEEGPESSKHTKGSWSNEVETLDDFSDISDQESSGEDGTNGLGSLSSELDEMQRCLSSREVTYELFETCYWPRFDKRTTYLFDPVLVWSEIISLIKGSEIALGTNEGYLSAEQYLNCSFRCFPTFRNNREQMYSVFEQYERMKRRTSHVDLMDQVHFMYHILNIKGYKGVPIHEVYCDEVQDLTISQIKLLQAICKNPKGFFLAGDTAQTIARGSAFRFEEVSAMMFRTHQEQIQKRDLTRQYRTPLAPARMQLSDNYRSHGGILSLAASIIELIETYFKGSIDSLKPDTALLHGPPPIFLEGSTHASLNSDLFGADSLQDNSIEFGADQVILVRSQEVKQAVQRKFKTGVVLTIYEAKGMEFNDVLLFDFFNDSPAQLKWRVFLPSTKDCKSLAPSFHEKKHAILCSELKHLYTAITRARKQLWIFDSSIDMRLPMLEYWRFRNLIQVENKPTRLAKRSTPEEWRHKSRTFFEQRLYKEAQFGFKKANEDESVRLCEANIQRQDAQASVDRGDMQTAKRLYYQSAELFKALGKLKAAAQTLMSGEHYTEAGEILCDMKDYDGAAKAFLKGEEYFRAAECMEKLQKFTEAVRLYKEGHHLEAAINKMQDPEYLHKVDKTLSSKVAKMYCIPLLEQAHHSPNGDPDINQCIKRALSLLSSRQQEKLLIDYGHVSLIQLFRDKEEEPRSERYVADAEMYSQHGQKQKAADLYLKAAQTLGMERIRPTQVAVQQEPKLLIEMSLECLLGALRMQIASVKPEILTFRIPGRKKNDENELDKGQIAEDDQAMETMFQAAQSFTIEAIQTYCKLEGLCNSAYNEPRCSTFEYSEKVNHAIMEVQEQYAQLTGNMIELQNYLETYSVAGGEAWLDAQLRVLFILCHAYMEGKFSATWDFWADLQSKLMHIYRILESSLSDRTKRTENQKYLNCCERFFRIKHLDKSFYLIEEDTINMQIVQLLQRWEAETKTEVIADKTPLGSATRVWQSLKSFSKKAMQIALGKWVQEILQFGAQHAQKGNILKKPCPAYANLGVCRKGEACHLVHSTTPASLGEYLLRLTKQSSFAHFQVKLAKDMSNYLDNKKENESPVRLAMGLSRYWLEKLQGNLHIISLLSANSSIVSQIYESSDMPKEGLTDLASRVWLKRLEYNPHNITRLLQIFYIIVQLGLNHIPYYCKRFTQPIKIGRFPLPVWLTPSKVRGFAWSMHSNLFNIIKHARKGDAGNLVWVGFRYIKFLVTEGCELECEQPWIILWLLEVIVAVSIAVRRRFHGITLPATVIYAFFTKQENLCKSIIHKDTPLCCSLDNLCELAMRIWGQKIWPLQMDDQWFVGSLRIQTILMVCSYHMDNPQLGRVWSWMQQVNQEMSQAPMHPSVLPVVNAHTLYDARKNLVSMLNSTQEPLAAVHVEGKSSVPWSEHNTSFTFEIDSSGSMKQVEKNLHPMEKFEAPGQTHEGIDEKNAQLDMPEEDINEDNEHEATLQEEVAAACLLQSWVRKVQAAKQILVSRDDVWDSKFDQACLVSKIWSSRRYRMLYLGVVMPRLYDLYKVHQSLETNAVKVRRMVAEADKSSLEKLLDQADTMRELRVEAERCLGALRVDNERHAEGNILFLKEAYRDAVKTLKKIERVVSNFLFIQPINVP